MSSGEEEPREEEEEPSQRYTQPLSALPPRVVQQEESQVEVSASPAFQCLDEVSFIINYLFTGLEITCQL